MRGAVIHAPGDVRFDDRADPAIQSPTDAIIRMSATCVCGSDLWDYRGINPVTQPTPMGHEYVGAGARRPSTCGCRWPTEPWSPPKASRPATCF